MTETARATWKRVDGNTTATITFNVSDDTLWSTFVTALEGGIGYWSLCYEYKPHDGPEDRDFYALVLDTVEHQPRPEPDAADPRLLRIDRGTILKGLKAALSGDCEVAASIADAALRDVRGNTSGHLDAEGADAIVQLGLFGEIVYG